MAETREAQVFEKDGQQIAVEPFSLKRAFKKHWKKGALVLVGGVLVYVGYKAGNKGKITLPKGNFFFANWPKGDEYTTKDLIEDFSLAGFGAKSQKNLPIPNGFELARIEELWKEDDDVLGIMNDIPITSLGDFGKELKEKIPELADKDFAHLACVGFTKFNTDGAWLKKEA